MSEAEMAGFFLFHDVKMRLGELVLEGQGRKEDSEGREVRGRRGGVSRGEGGGIVRGGRRPRGGR